jgi:DNA-directed RNA polymerase subunit alpha
LNVEKGRGYVTSEENKSNSLDVNFISIDSVFTPIINVKYNIENTRVEQKTDFEKLVIDIQTNGSIHPEDALKGAAQILIKHFYLFSDKDMEFAEDDSDELEVVDEELLHMRKLLKTSLNDLDLSVRAFNCLKAADIRTLGDLVSVEISDMMKFRNFGKKSLTELEELIDNKGLNFGMDLDKYNLD